MKLYSRRRTIMSFWGKNKKATAADQKRFKVTKQIGNYMWIDEVNQLIMVSTKDMMKPKYLLRFDNIISFSIVQDNKEVLKKSGVKRAIAGGILFGPTGAIVGAITGSEKSVNYVSNLWIKIDLDGKDTERNFVNIPLIVARKTATNSDKYKSVATSVERIIEFLSDITESEDEESIEIIEETQMNNDDEFEKIKRYKDLLDRGILTQDEFDKKKQELLKL